MERAARGIRKAHSLAEDIGDSQFVNILDSLHVESMSGIRDLATLRRLVEVLEDFATRHAA
jgi:hypothetical protein